MQKIISDMLLDIAHERNGYSIGEPWRFTEHSLAAVVPLARESQGRKRLYRLFSERKNEVKVKDTGNIERLTLISKSEFPILVKAGEVLTGSTQSRTITISQILMPGEKLTVPCACVYSSKGIMEGQDMIPTVFSPLDVRREVYRGHYERRGGLEWGNFADGYFRDQGRIWGGVKTHAKTSSRRLGTLCAYAASHNIPDVKSLGDLDLNYHTPSEDLAGRVSESQNKYRDILKKIPKIDSQIGMALLTMTGLESMEAFEHTDAWDGIRKSILGAESDKISDVSDQDGLFEFKTEKAKSIIQDLLTKDFNEKVVVDREKTKTIMLDTKKFVGEAVTLNDTPIHLTFVRKEG